MDRVISMIYTLRPTFINLTLGGPFKIQTVNLSSFWRNPIFKCLVFRYLFFCFSRSLIIVSSGLLALLFVVLCLRLNRNRKWCGCCPLSPSASCEFPGDVTFFMEQGTTSKTPKIKIISID